ncbi:O-antigen ligase family protein [Hymenobacter sp. BRD128]|uniref:O-antigen ligase family protein n=1 Tax=Hymenobacter sp. BRD128 TaxID=2675878 RepID=UPI0015638AE6|nr:O-antigen ligase family protein [Hymenobacter sp. BRD128]QKG58495.1 O-antigen ligase family protein [Hymenobacter sp. BRD128]
MPTIPDHIRFSLLISMAVLTGAVLVFDKTLAIRLRRATAAGVILLFIFQHLLAVRSGLATMYVGGVLWLGWLGWQQRRWRVVFTTTVLLAALAGGCLLLFPTLQNKITNTRDDTDRLSSVDAANNYSVTARVYSYKVAWVIIREHPLLGVSKVKMDEAMAEQYGYMYPQIARRHYLMPHNQFIYNMVAYGLVGLGVFLLGFYYPLWLALRRRNITLVLLYVVVTLSFLVEYTLETHIGILTGLFFLLLATEPAAPTPVAGCREPDAAAC